MTKDTTTSAVEQNNDTKPADNENVANQPAVQGNDTPTDNVPYARFNEVNKQLRDMEAKLKASKQKEEKRRVATMEEQGKFKELNAELQTKYDSLQKENAYYKEQEQKEREVLLHKLPEQERAVYGDLSTDILRIHINNVSKMQGIRTDKSGKIRGSNLDVKSDSEIWKMDQKNRQKNWKDVIKHFKK